jgi:hypothetical protein
MGVIEAIVDEDDDFVVDLLHDLVDADHDLLSEYGLILLVFLFKRDPLDCEDSHVGEGLNILEYLFLLEYLLGSEHD